MITLATNKSKIIISNIASMMLIIKGNEKSNLGGLNIKVM